MELNAVYSNRRHPERSAQRAVEWTRTNNVRAKPYRASPALFAYKLPCYPILSRSFAKGWDRKKLNVLSILHIY